MTSSSSSPANQSASTATAAMETESEANDVDAPPFLSRVIGFLNGRRCLHSLLPQTLFLGVSTRAPLAVLKFHALLTSIALLVYGFSAAVASLPTDWVGVIVLYLVLIHQFLMKVARSIVLPGSFSLMNRGAETKIATVIFTHIRDACTRGVDPNSPPPHLHDQLVRLSRMLAPYAKSLHEYYGEDLERSTPLVTRRRAVEFLHGMMDFQTNPTLEILESSIIPNLDLFVSSEPRGDVKGKLSEKSSSSQIERHETIEPTWVERYWIILMTNVRKYMDSYIEFPGLASLEWMRTHIVVTASASGMDARQVAIPCHARSGRFLSGILFMPLSSPPLPSPRQPHQTTTTTNDDGESPRRVVAYLNPNAGLMEHTILNPFWREFYVKRMGVSFLIFNYGGFGFGEQFSSPSPDTLREDAVSVIRWLRRELGYAKITLHAESVGGVPAAHVSMTEGVEAVIFDRTFSTLSAVATALTTPKLATLLRIVTRWKADNVNRELFTRALLSSSSTPDTLTPAVVVIQDAEDHIIPHEASLKAGVARLLCERLVESFSGSEQLTTTRESSNVNEDKSSASSSSSVSPAEQQPVHDGNDEEEARRETYDFERLAEAVVILRFLVSGSGRSGTAPSSTPSAGSTVIIPNFSAHRAIAVEEGTTRDAPFRSFTYVAGRTPSGRELETLIFALFSMDGGHGQSFMHAYKRDFSAATEMRTQEYDRAKKRTTGMAAARVKRICEARGRRKDGLARFEARAVADWFRCAVVWPAFRDERSPTITTPTKSTPPATLEVACEAFERFLQLHDPSKNDLEPFIREAVGTVIRTLRSARRDRDAFRARVSSTGARDRLRFIPTHVGHNVQLGSAEVEELRAYLLSAAWV